MNSLSEVVGALDVVSIVVRAMIGEWRFFEEEEVVSVGSSVIVVLAMEVVFAVVRVVFVSSRTVSDLVLDASEEAFLFGESLVEARVDPLGVIFSEDKALLMVAVFKVADPFFLGDAGGVVLVVPVRNVLDEVCLTSSPSGGSFTLPPEVMTLAWEA